MSTIAENIQSLEAARANKESRLGDITKACAEEDRTKTDAEREEFDTLRDDIKAIDLEIKDLQDLEAIQKRAVPVNGNGTEAASKSRDTSIRVTPRDNPEKGIQFARLAMALYAAEGKTDVAMGILKTHYPSHPALTVLKTANSRGQRYAKLIGNAAEMRTKADIPAGSTSDETWAGPLLAHNDYAGDFLEFLRDRTILGQFGQGGVPSLRMIPFNVHIKGQTSGGTGYWVGEGQPKPVTKFDFLDTYHGFNKLACIAVITDELIRFSDPSAERLVRDSLADAVIETMDTSFIDTVAATTSRPAGLLNNVAGTGSAGSDHDAVKEDIKTLWSAGIAAKLPLSGAVYITTSSIALALSLMHGDLSDAPLFPNINLRGGTLLGVPVIVSDYVPAGNVILVFASEIYLSDDGTVTVDASNQASIQMVDGESATNASTDLDEDYPAPVHSTTVSMFQTNSVALRAERYINWSKRREAAVARITGVDWGAGGS